MPSFRKGDIVRVPFPYADRAPRQHRPALVVSNDPVGEAGAPLWVRHDYQRREPALVRGRPLGAAYQEAGLPAPSVVRPCKIATIEARHADGIGRMRPDLLRQVEAEIQAIFGGAPS